MDGEEVEEDGSLRKSSKEVKEIEEVVDQEEGQGKEGAGRGGIAGD